MRSANATARDSTFGHSANGAFNYSLRDKTQGVDGDALDELLRSRVGDGFATSAYWGATGEVPPREPDDQVPKQRYPFQAEINRKLVPLPKEQTSFPRTLDYAHVGLHHTSAGADSVDVGLNASQLRQLGDVDVGLGKKPRFLNMTTTNQAIPRAFDDDVLRALREGQDAEDDAQRRLEELKGSPLNGGADPNPYRTTTDDYCDFSGVNPSSYRQKEYSPAGGEGEGDVADADPLDVYRSRYNNVEREGPRRRERTYQVMQRGRRVDNDALKGTLRTLRETGMPRGYEAFSAKDWMSTTHREHAMYDTTAASTMNDRNATEPVRNVNYALTAKDDLAVTAKDERFSTRHGADWPTEYSESYVEKEGEADIARKHGLCTIFDIDHGVYTMNHHFHHPREDVQTGESYTAAELVPGQYKTMYTEPLHAPNRPQ